jgi:hypothetical protein
VIVTVLNAGAGPGDYATVRLSSEPDGVNPPDVFELTVALKHRPYDAPRGFDVLLRAGTTFDLDGEDEGSDVDDVTELFAVTFETTAAQHTEGGT